MIRQNRAVPILLVLTFAFILSLAGCFGSEQTSTAIEETPTPIPTPTAAPVVSEDLNVETINEEPFYHTVEPGDQLGSIASKYNVSPDVIIRANPEMDPNLIIAGERLLIPGAGTNNEAVEDLGPDRPDGVTVNYLVQPGDTFGFLAQTWTVSLDALVAANPDVDPGSLQINQILVIPPWGSGIDPADLQPRSTPIPVNRQPNDPPIEHVVSAGEFLSGIAELYGVTREQIVEANDLPDGGNNLQIGQPLLIPPPLPTPTPEPTPEPAGDGATDESGDS